MPRKSATQQREPASLPDTLVPLSDVPEHQRGAYEIEAINDPDMLQKILSNENFFEMIASFPDAWWSGGRLSMYLYRHENDDGLMIKNPVGEGNYIKPVIRQPVDRDWIANRNGGGKYQLWLNLSSPNPSNPAKSISTTVRKYTFRIDGPPMVKEGQVIELGGKPISVAGTSAANTPQPAETALDKVIDANSRANESSMEIVTSASKAAIAMVQEQAKNSVVPQQDPFALAVKLVELMRPQAPTVDPVQAELMKKIIEKAFREPEEPRESERAETPLENVDTIVQQITGKSLADVARGAGRGAAESEYAWVAPVADLGVKVLAMLPQIFAQARAAKKEDFDRAVYLEHLRNGKQATPQPPPVAQLPATASVTQPHVSTPAENAQPPARMDRAQTIHGIVARICQGFDRHRDLGSDIAAALCVELGEYIEAYGLEPALADPKKMQPILGEFPQLAGMMVERMSDARWKRFEADLMGYFHDRYGVDEDDEPERPGPQAIDAPQPPAA